MKIAEILQSKGHEVVTVDPDRTVLEAMRVLVEHNIGAVVVVAETEEILGILSERDVLRLGAEMPQRLADCAVAEAMTRELIVGVAEDDVHYAMGIMTDNRIRHLPIVGKGGLEGIISIGDLLSACRSEAESENRYLRDYIQGSTR